MLPLFIFDPDLLSHPETAVVRVAFLLDNLRALDRDLRKRGSRLLVRWGEPAATLLAVVRSYRADAVVVHNDSERILGRVRDGRVKRQLADAGVPVHWIEPPGAMAPLISYPTYRRRWHDAMAETSLVSPPRLATPPPLPGEPPDVVPDLAALGLSDDGKPRPTGGTAAALGRLQHFCTSASAARYYWELSYPAAKASSGLSPYLKFGVVSHRQCLQGIAELQRADAGRRRSWRQLVSRLRWGAGMAQRFRYLPQLELEPLWRCHRDDTATVLSTEQEELYRRWQEGLTGFPIVDAASRCLLATGGWRELNFRSRAIHASFLTNLCGIDWRYGALHYMRHLLDGDCPIDHYQWALQAGVTVGGSGAWTRIYHPGQIAVERCDPQGVFIRRWLPELADLTNDQLGAPPRMEAYPRPALDYERARKARLTALEGRRLHWRRGDFSALPLDLTPFGASRFPLARTEWCRGPELPLWPPAVDPEALDSQQRRQLESWFVMARPSPAARPAPPAPRSRRRSPDPGVEQLELWPQP